MTEYEKYVRFVEENGYIPDISYAAMARMDDSPYKKGSEQSNSGPKES